MTCWAELWAEAAAGDGAVFAQFYQRHADRVFSHCYRRLGSREDAEDLVAEVFAATWRHRGRVMPHDEVDILPWLLTTANNLLRHHHRSVTRARRLLQAVPRDELIPDFSDDIVEQDANDRTMRTITVVLDLLRAADREIIGLCVLDGLRPADLAATTGEPAGTVRARLSRALTRARRIHRSMLELDATRFGVKK